MAPLDGDPFADLIPAQAKAPEDPFADLIPAAPAADPFADLAPAAPAPHLEAEPFATLDTEQPDTGLSLPPYSPEAQAALADAGTSYSPTELPDPNRPEGTLAEIFAERLRAIPGQVKDIFGGAVVSALSNVPLAPPGAAFLAPEAVAAHERSRAAVMSGEDPGELATWATELSNAGAADVHAGNVRLNLDQESAKGYLNDITTGIIEMVPTLAVGIATKSPNMGLSVMGTQVYGRSFADARRSGRTVEQANLDAVFNLLSETLPERMPLGVIMSSGGKFMPSLLKAMGAEAIQEQVTEALQIGYDMGVLDKNVTWGEAWRRLKHAGIVGAGVGAGLKTAAHPFTRAEDGEGPPPPDNLTPADRASPIADSDISTGKRLINEALAAQKRNIPEGAVPADVLFGTVDEEAPSPILSNAPAVAGGPAGQIFPADHMPAAPAPVAPAAPLPAATPAQTFLDEQLAAGKTKGEAFEEANRTGDPEFARAVRTAIEADIAATAPESVPQTQEPISREIPQETPAPLPEPPPGAAERVNKLASSTKTPLNPEAVGKALDLEPEIARRLLDEMAAKGTIRKTGGSKLVGKGADQKVVDTPIRYRRKPTFDRPADVLTFIAANGGLRDDEGHNLKAGKGAQKFIPGFGPVIRPDGLSVEELGELLHEDGRFGPLATTPRPSEAEVLDYLEPAWAGKKIYHPDEQENVEAAAAEADFDSENARQIDVAIAETGIELSDDERAVVHKAAAGGLDIYDAIERAMLEAEAEAAEEIIETRPEIDDVPLEESADENAQQGPRRDGEVAPQEQPAREDIAGTPGEGAARGEERGQDGGAPSEEGQLEPKPLYANRPVTNAADIIEWAKGQGFTSTLLPEDMHVTIAFSRDPVAWDAVDEATDTIGNAPTAGARSVEKLGDEGAVVLRFENDRLQKRWRQYQRAGASWDFEDYKPHITITYDAGDVDISKVEPYRGLIELGPEQQEDLDTDAVSKVKEAPTDEKEATAPGKEPDIQPSPKAGLEGGARGTIRSLADLQAEIAQGGVQINPDRAGHCYQCAIADTRLTGGDFVFGLVATTIPAKPGASKIYHAWAADESGENFFEPTTETWYTREAFIETNGAEILASQPRAEVLATNLKKRSGIGPPLFGYPLDPADIKAPPVATDQTDQGEQTVMEGMEKSAKQAQQARDEKGGIQPKARQKEADEGLFAAKPDERQTDIEGEAEAVAPTKDLAEQAEDAPADTLPSEELPADSAAVLAEKGITVIHTTTTTGKPVWNVHGIPKGAIGDYIMANRKKLGASWYRRDKNWSFWNGDPTEVIAALVAGNDPNDATRRLATKDAGPGVDPLKDDERRERREREDARADERPDVGDVVETVGEATKQLIRRGVEFNVPAEIVAEQIEDVALGKSAYVQKKPMFLLANAAGTGKTFVLGALAREIKTVDNPKIFYVTQSVDLIEQIKRDLAEYDVGDMQFVTYASISDISVEDATDAVILFDEAHNVKNVDSQRGKHVNPLMAAARFTVMASATPYENPVQAEYLEPTGIFDSVGGFKEWAKMYGAAVRTFKQMTSSGMETVEVVYWTGGKAKQKDAAAARSWLDKQGLMTQRSMRIDASMVDVEGRQLTVSDEYVGIYNDVTAAYENAVDAYLDEDGSSRDSLISAQIAMHRENAIKRILEAAKADGAIARAKELLDAGKNVVVFVETKSDRTLGKFKKAAHFKDKTLYSYPQIQELMDEWKAEADMARMQGERAPPRPFADFIVEIARHMDAAGINFELPSTADQIKAELSSYGVGIYTGAVTQAKASQAKADFLSGKLKVLIATMAKGGTGLSLHDTVGTRPTVQINLNLPWSATKVDQVAARVARYGLQSKAAVEWLFAENIPWERNNLMPRVAGRMRDMGAVVKGMNVEMADVMDAGFDFEGTVNLKGLTEIEGVEEAIADLDDIYGQAQRLENTRRKADDTSGGFFATPYPVSALMTKISGVTAGDRVLEPSAGTGNLVKFVPDGATVDLIEQRHDNWNALNKITNTRESWTAVHADFLDWAADSAGGYNVVLMNPPFERVKDIGPQDIAHVRKAYDLLSSNGRLVAIMGEGAFFREQKADKAFREWLDEVGATVVKLPEDAFKKSGTGVRARMVVIDKGAQDPARTDLDMESLETSDLREIELSVPSRAAVDDSNARLSRSGGPSADAPFFSALTRAVEALKFNKAPPAQWQGAIKNAQGVKTEEVDWSGVNDWLDAQKGAVTKDDVLAFLRANEVQVEEVTLGGKIPKAAVDRLRAWAEEAFGPADANADVTVEDWALIQRGDADAIGRLEGLGAPDALMSPIYDNINEGGARFSQWQLPGGENYRELLLTLPVETQDVTFRVVGNKDGVNFDVVRVVGGVDDEVHLRSVPLSEADQFASEGNKKQHKRKSDNTFTGGHFDEPNVLAHIRFNERTDADGKRVLFIEEIQSDWHQKGRKQGYQPKDVTPKDFAIIETPTGEFAVQGIDRAGTGHRMNTFATRDEAADQIAMYKRNGVPGVMLDRFKSSSQGVPDAPFKSTWHELAFKRILRYAAENDFDSISWTTGAQQVDRYESALRSAVDEIHWEKTPEGVHLKGYKGATSLNWERDNPPPTELTELPDSYTTIHDMHPNFPGREWSVIPADQGHARPLSSTHVSEKEAIADAISYINAQNRAGWEQLRSNAKANNAPVVDTTEKESALSDAIGKSMGDQILADTAQSGVIKGDGITVSSTGMAGFYDLILPRFANKYGKKWGAKAGRMRFEGSPMTVTRDDTGFPVSSVGGVTPQTVHTFPVTDAMRESVLQGQPLFQRGGSGRRFNANFGRSVEQIGKDLQARLKQVGIADKVALRLVENITTTVDGKATPAMGRQTSGLIEVSQKAFDGEWVLDHEIIHALRDLDLIRSAEWTALSKAAKADTKRMASMRKKRAADNLTEEQIVEEVVADMFADWAADRSQTSGFVRRAFERIRDFFKSLGGALNKAGYSEVNDIFEAVERGDVGRRERGGARPRAGARLAAAWHGTGHDFDRFSTDAIGTGEGFQTFGWGLYFAGRRKVAEFYRNKLAGASGTIPADVMNELADADFFGFDSPGAALAEFRMMREAGESWEEGFDMRPDHAGDMESARIINAYLDRPENKGRLFEVELKPAEDEYLLWDKPLSEQSEKVKAALQRAAEDRGGIVGNPSGADIYQYFFDGVHEGRAASLALRDAGIPGIKYLDAGSRGFRAVAPETKGHDWIAENSRGSIVAKGTEKHVKDWIEKNESNNYVIFDDSAVEVTGKYSRDDRSDRDAPIEVTPEEAATPEGRQSAFKRLLNEGSALDRVFRLPFTFVGGVAPDGKWKPGLWLEKKGRDTVREAKFSPEGRFAWMNSTLETARAGWLDRYGLPEDYVERGRRTPRDERTILLEGVEVIKSLKDQNTTIEEAQVLQAILNGEPVNDAKWEKIAVPIRQSIDMLGQEAVALGQVSAESYERNRGTYLHRVYMIHEGQQDGLSKWANSMMAKNRQKIIGDHLKGRGIFQDIEAKRILRDLPGYAEGKRGRLVKGEKIIMLDVVDSTGDLPGMDHTGPGPRTTRRVFWPAETPIPERLKGLVNRGTFEVRQALGRKVTLWRDFTKAERESMGEILDARYTLTKTYMVMAHDIATGRFYKDISESGDWARNDIPNTKWVDAAEYRRMWSDPSVEWVKVPETAIPETGGKKKWGALSGKFVRAGIWRDLNEVDLMQRPGMWKKLLTQWKLNKTARSPVVHMNNIMSNFLLMDMADIRMRDFVAGVRAYVRETADFQEAQDNGAFGSDMITQEIKRDVLLPLLKELQTEEQGGGSLEGRIGMMGKLADRLWTGLKATDQWMIDRYRMEDEVFRMATYMRRRSLGDTPLAAASTARQQFLDYDIRAPWVNMLRRSVLPFISYTYRAAPVIAKSIAHHPWKIAKYYTIFTALNALAYAMAPGDEDEERRTLREEEQGYTWVATPRMLRMPYRDQNGNPVFLDIRRWIPAGDIFDLGQGHAAFPVPASLMFGGPIMLAGELLFNKSAFTGNPLINDNTDDIWDKSEKLGDWAWKSWMPSAAWVPGSWYFTAIGNALTGVRDRAQRPLSVPQALSSSIGIKLKPQDVERNQSNWGWAFDRVERDLRRDMKRLGSDLERGITSQEGHDASLRKLLRKFENLEQNRIKTLEPPR